MESNDGENVNKTLIGDSSIPYLLKNVIRGGLNNDPISQGKDLIEKHNKFSKRKLRKQKLY